MKSDAAAVGGNAARPSRGRYGGFTRARFACAGLTLALVLAMLAPMLARYLPMGIEGATFSLAAVCLVGLGYVLGGRVEALEVHSLEDPVTRVGNRRHWEQHLSEEVSRATRSRMPISLLVLDVDNLKKLNDAQGHGCGDRALTIVGDVLLDTCRSRDVAARFGGDEFVVLLPRTRASEAKVVCERIRSEIARRRVGFGAPLDPALTVSIGVADLDAAEVATGEALFEAADRALYAAKAAGRDRVVVAERLPVASSGIIRLDEARAERKGRLHG